MRASQHAVYRNEIHRLHRYSDTLSASNQILRDAMPPGVAVHLKAYPRRTLHAHGAGSSVDLD